MIRVPRKSVRGKRGKYDVNAEYDYPRPLWAIEEAEEEMFDRVWFMRNTVFVENEKGDFILKPRHEVGAWKVEDLLEKYGGMKNLVPKDDFECGMWNGKLSALRWVLGSEWDFLDT